MAWIGTPSRLLVEDSKLYQQFFVFLSNNQNRETEHD